MKPKLKPSKGWKYRLLLCDHKGDYVFDDYNALPVVKVAMMLLVRDFEKIKIGKSLKEVK